MVPYLSRLPPEDKEGNLTLIREFRISNVTRVEGPVYLDLYFKTPLFNLTGLIELFVVIFSALSNISGLGPSQNRSLIDILKNLSSNASMPSLNFTLPEKHLLFPEIGYNITISVGNVTTSRIIKVGRTSIEATPKVETIEDIFANLTYYIQEITKIKSSIVHKTVKLENINVTGKDRKNLIVRVECTDETLLAIAPIIELLKMTNRSELETLIELYLGLVNLTKFSFLTGLFVSFLELLIEKISGSVGFIYNSADYPSNLKFYGFISGIERYGIERYYLKSIKTDTGQELILQEGEITSNVTIEKKITSNAMTWMLEPFDEPTRILGNVTVHLYIKCKSPTGIYPIEVSIFDEIGYHSTKVASTTTKIFGWRYIKPTPIDIVIEGIDHTFEKDHSIALSLKLVNRTVGGIELTIYRPLVLFNSTEYASCMIVTTAPLNDIKLEFSDDTELYQKIKRVDVKHYNITITNKGETGDNLSLELIIYDKTYYQWPSGWKVVIELPNGTREETYSDWKGRIYLSGKDSKEIIVNVFPSPDSKNGTEVEFVFSATGEYRGSALLHDTIEISVGKIEVAFTEEPKNKKVTAGKTHVYTFKIKNVGEDVDDFVVNATSEHNWIVGDSTFVIDNLYPGNESKFNITIKVPENLSYFPFDDDLKVVVASISNPSKTDVSWVITTAVEPTVLERITSFFEGVSEELHERFGDYTIYVVATILVLFILTIVVLIYFIRKKDIMVVCLERVKELSPDEEDRFDITVRNLTNRKLSYKVDTSKSHVPDGWEIKLSDEEIELDPKGEKVILLHVKPTTRIAPDEWAEIKVSLIPKEGKKHYLKHYLITLLALPRDANIDLKLEKVTHSPKIFKSGDTVITKLDLVNRGNVSAKNIKVTLHLNGVKMNEVNITEIPPGGRARIEIPWLASPGRNDIHILAETWKP